MFGSGKYETCMELLTPSSITKCALNITSSAFWFDVEQLTAKATHPVRRSEAAADQLVAGLHPQELRPHVTPRLPQDATQT